MQKNLMEWMNECMKCAVELNKPTKANVCVCVCLHEYVRACVKDYNAFLIGGISLHLTIFSNVFDLENENEKHLRHQNLPIWELNATINGFHTDLAKFIFLFFFMFHCSHLFSIITYSLFGCCCCCCWYPLEASCVPYKVCQSGMFINSKHFIFYLLRK